MNHCLPFPRGAGGGLGAGLTHVVIGDKAQPQPDVGEGDSPTAQWLTVHQHPRSDTGEPQSPQRRTQLQGLTLRKATALGV